MIQNRYQIAILLLSFRYFTDGLENSMILPTVTEYMNTRFNESISYVGLALSAYGVGGIVSGPLFGTLQDWSGRGDLIIIAGSLISALGNFVYIAAAKKQYLILGRFLCGINCDAVLLGEIGKMNFLTRTDRAKYVSNLFIGKAFGRFVAPLIVMACDGFETKQVFGIELSKYNLPSVFVVVTYLLVMIGFCFYNWSLAEMKGVVDDSETKMSLPKPKEQAEILQVLCYPSMVIANGSAFMIYFMDASFQASTGSLYRD